jgi:Flp pilus assembly protein TadB
MEEMTELILYFASAGFTLAVVVSLKRWHRRTKKARRFQRLLRRFEESDLPKLSQPI